MRNREGVNKLLEIVAAQGEAYERRAKSRVEQQYGTVMRIAAGALVRFINTASLDDLILVEKAFQENDLAIYAQIPATIKSVQEGIDDLKEGEAAYKLLIESTHAYKEHPYRKKERANPEKIIPLDAMRRALRGQVKRLENYRKNVMSNPKEQEFISARIAMLHRAEKLYDAIQRERLLPPDSDV
jgi:hypothetical protein